MPRNSQSTGPLQCRVYIDLSHLGRHVTGIERVTIEQFEKVNFSGADIRLVRSTTVVGMILKQQILLPLLALLNPRALFVFPGFPPSPIFRLFRERTLLYVHDAFLITRPHDLSRKAKVYMAWPFKWAVSSLKYFLANSEKTRGEIKPFVAGDAAIALYRPSVDNVFGLSTQEPDIIEPAGKPIRLVSLGTVEPRKNYLAAARILASLRATVDPLAELHIIGRSGWGTDAEEIARQPGVVIHGYLPAADVKALLQSADLYICTSHDEGLGLPLLEAQFSGIQVTAPDAPVFREVLGTSGLFIDPNDPGAAAARIAACLKPAGRRVAAAVNAAANIDRWNRLAGEDRGSRVAVGIAAAVPARVRPVRQPAARAPDARHHRAGGTARRVGPAAR